MKTFKAPRKPAKPKLTKRKSTKPKSIKKAVARLAAQKKPAADDLYEQGDMATPERDAPYEDGL